MTSEGRGRDIICLSHLKWEETLFQRPQQIMTQLARTHRVLYVGRMGAREAFAALVGLERRTFMGKRGKNLSCINVPYLPLTRRFGILGWIMWGACAACALLAAKLLGFRKPWLWVYHPGYVPFLGLLRRDKLVYDCMDLFRGFKTSSARCAMDEAALLEKADVVFTGGKSLQKAHAGKNPNTFCLPSGVDFDHFARATLDETPIPEDVRDLPKPILGYFGAVDERLDFDLIRRLCDERPGRSIVLVGPLVGFLSPPVKRPNLHYLGEKEYADLPGYLKAFDVCLMPFVISELTLHISPTKTPEYLAGGKPVVSTAIPDVVEDYADLVAIGEDHDDFATKVDLALKESRAGRRLRVKERPAAKSWRRIAEEMEDLILRSRT